MSMAGKVVDRITVDDHSGITDGAIISLDGKKILIIECINEGDVVIRPYTYWELKAAKWEFKK